MGAVFQACGAVRLAASAALLWFADKLAFCSSQARRRSQRLMLHAAPMK
jgi:hypothetical protein